MTCSYNKAARISKELAERKAKLETESYQAWVKAREASDWAAFAPKLKALVALNAEIAAAVDPDKSVYDSALDNFEKGFTSARVDEIFAELKAGVIPLIAEIKGGTRPDDAWLQGQWDVKKQAELCATVVKDLGFCTKTGRLDVSVHPFTCGMHPEDVRITTRFKESDLMEGITGAVHECGHAMYEQGRNPEYEGLPISAALSLGVHESQSLLWERMVALTPAFCKFLLPKIQADFPEFGKGKTPEVRGTPATRMCALQAMTAHAHKSPAEGGGCGSKTLTRVADTLSLVQDLYAAINTMKDPSLIRVESDEVTYPLHVIIRYEVERDMINGSLSVDDVPATWNAKMQEYLGCTPPDDKQVHPLSLWPSPCCLKIHVWSHMSYNSLNMDLDC